MKASVVVAALFITSAFTKDQKKDKDQTDDKNKDQDQDQD
jgi:hypothetical protein